MFLVRKIGSVLRGKATPRQVLLATLLGGMLGFVPGFFLPGDLGGGLAQAPGLILLLVCAVLVLNANLAVFGLVTLVAKLLSLVLLPVSYGLGTWLLDGPLQGLFRWLINSKVVAWFGLEYYATAGGVTLGVVFGLATGIGLNRSIRAIRARMAGIEEHSEGYQKYAQKRWVKLCTWLLLGGGKGKQSWQELAESKRQGLPIRISGCLVAAVAIASVWVLQTWFSTPILTRNLQGALQSMNGATVDLQSAELSLGDGALRVKQLAIADRQALDRDLFAADELTATVDTGELLRRRLVIDRVVAANARGGAPRASRGIVIVDPTAPTPPPPPAPPEGTKTAADWLRDFEVWQARLEQVRGWIEGMGGGDTTPPAERSPQDVAADRAEQERTKGIASVMATHLIDGGPRVLVREIDIRGITWSLGGTTDSLDLLVKNLSDAPSLVADAMHFGVTSKSDDLRLQLTGATAASPAIGLEFAFRRLPVDAIFGQLKLSGAPPVRGGTIDITSKGSLRSVVGQALALDLPLQVALKDTTFALAGAQETKVDSLLLPIGRRAPMTQPAVTLDDQALQQALLAAGHKELANFVQGQAGKLLGGLPKDLQGLVDPSKTPGEIVDEAKQKAAAEAERLKQEAAKKAADEAKKLLPGGLQGLLPGGKKQ
jgi:uncharacterized protein (TIGR03546 family)